VVPNPIVWRPFFHRGTISPLSLLVAVFFSSWVDSADFVQPDSFSPSPIQSCSPVHGTFPLPPICTLVLKAYPLVGGLLFRYIRIFLFFS